MRLDGDQVTADPTTVTPPCRDEFIHEPDEAPGGPAHGRLTPVTLRRRTSRVHQANTVLLSLAIPRGTMYG